MITKSGQEPVLWRDPRQVIGDKLRAHTDERRATKVAVAVYALNRMLDLGRPSYVRIA